MQRPEAEAAGNEDVTFDEISGSEPHMHRNEPAPCVVISMTCGLEPSRASAAAPPTAMARRRRSEREGDLLGGQPERAQRAMAVGGIVASDHHGGGGGTALFIFQTLQ